MTELRATYRLQLTPTFGFADARRVVPYLRSLGVSHLYLSPSLQARRGSEHGYDVVDPTRLSDDRGGEEQFRALASAGLGVVLDIVPNHMAADDANPRWSDPEHRQRTFDVDPGTGRHRRFFDVDDLAGVRQEDPEVFADTHAKVLALVAEGVVDGLRIDHPDGLADPAGYLRALWAEGVPRVWVEKVLQPGEELRGWPVSGTTGYEHLADVGALLVDGRAEEQLTEVYGELTGEHRPFAEFAREGRREQATTTFTPEVDRLRRLADVPGIVDVLVGLPVYRTYVDPATGLVAPEDRVAIEAAGTPAELARILLLEERGHDEFVRRFQQTSPAVVAKGVEDTACYRYHRLLSLNEVGNDPGRFTLSVDELHAGNQRRLDRFPESLLAATTHDTKRSADCRARIGSLASQVDDYERHLRHWYAITGPLVDRGAPDEGERWFLFQTLLGVWPITPERLDAYVTKALREAKLRTSWLHPDGGWEQRVRAFARALLSHGGFLADFRPFADRVARAGERASVAEVVIRTTVPGVPDVYQGDETWFLGLVDPDNRRPVDWSSRQRDLRRVQRGAAPTRATRKLHVLHRALELRARRPAPFAEGYAPLEAGPGSLAFLRGDAELLVVVELRPDGGGSVDVPTGRWRDVLSGPELDLGGPTPVSELTAALGATVLERLS